jgi:cation diffusion facilitator family transporter
MSRGRRSKSSKKSPNTYEAGVTHHALAHDHVFHGQAHARNERRTWIVVGLCAAMMLLEIGGGLAFGSIALVADGLHMSTHAGALMLAALAYTFSRRYASDPRFTFGAGKFGDLAGFTSALVLAMIALLIGYEAVTRIVLPTAIHFREAIPIAVLGLGVNVASAWLLGAGGHDHGHQGHGHDHHAHGHDHHDREHDHHYVGRDAHHRDNNMRAAMVHVMADAAVSVLVITGLILARLFGWLWMDPLAGIVGALVIASWSFSLIRDTGAILLDMNPDQTLGQRMREAIEAGGDQVADLHLWRLGPGHLGAIVTVATDQARPPSYYRDRLAKFDVISHLTIEVGPSGPRAAA